MYEMKKTKQTDFWINKFGKEYTDRCTFNKKEVDERFLIQFGKSKLELDNEFLGTLPREIRILEVGCNTGQKLVMLQAQGFFNLFGVELQRYAVENAKKTTKEIDIIQGSAFDIPYKDECFDLVFTSGVLIHIAPDDLQLAMAEIHRCTSKYIWGWEYFAENIEEIEYRDNNDFLWKADYCQMYLNQFKDLKLVKKEFVPFINEPEKGNKNVMFLLEKVK